jgi:hypothetical protein
MRNFVINNGSFTASGNFSGYTALGERVHIFGRQMQALGWSKQEDVKFPFYAIGTIKPVGKLDDNGKPVLKTDGQPDTSDRLTALSAFKTRDEIKQAHADAALLDVEIQKEIHTQAKEAGLNEKQLEMLASVRF